MSTVIGNEVLVEQRGHVLIAQLNRPAKRNAINRRLAEQLLAAINTANEDASVRACVLASSTPEMFCAGFDLAAISSGEFNSPDGSRFHSFTRVVRNKPWIAAVSGPVLGGGLEMALASEMIIASERASFGLPEVKRGILAGGGGVFRLARAIPRAVAMEMVLTGRPISAARAHVLGLVNYVVPESNILGTAVELAEAVAACAPLSIIESLVIARNATELPEADLWTMTDVALNRLQKSADAKEGIAAFLEKRTPNWSGKAG
jgi:enoyl-CoA hydratase/carnithine racemase